MSATLRPSDADIAAAADEIRRMRALSEELQTSLTEIATELSVRDTAAREAITLIDVMEYRLLSTEELRALRRALWAFRDGKT